MGGPEANIRRAVVAALAPLHAVSVENMVGAPGMPDVNHAGGWLELKCVDGWPARAETPLRVPHFTPQQRLWLRARCRAGGAAWLLIRVGRINGDWLLFWGETAAEVLGHANKSQLQETAAACWPRRLPGEELLRWMRKTSP